MQRGREGVLHYLWYGDQIPCAVRAELPSTVNAVHCIPPPPKTKQATLALAPARPRHGRRVHAVPAAHLEAPPFLVILLVTRLVTSAHAPRPTRPASMVVDVELRYKRVFKFCAKRRTCPTQAEAEKEALRSAIMRQKHKPKTPRSFRAPP